jgi:hypothetical protein
VISSNDAQMLHGAGIFFGVFYVGKYSTMEHLGIVFMGL